MSQPVHRSASAGDAPFSAVLLDLDGTITDSAPVILGALEGTLASLGLPVAPREELMSFVGPPLSEGFRVYAGLEGEARDAALTTYRRLYREHMLEAPVYDGVPEVLRDLAERGTPLALATSKREDLAVEILEHWGLSTYFTVVCGAGHSEASGTKVDVVRRALARLSEAGADVSRVVHVGDRAHDVEGAHEAGVACVGVLWGYGDADELSEAEWLATDSTELAELLNELLDGSAEA